MGLVAFLGVETKGADDKEQPFYHQPVMVREVVEQLRCKEGGAFVDLTVGEGGHASKILEASSKVFLIGVDWDEEILERARERLKPFEGRFALVRDNFVNLPTILEDLEIREVDGVLLDLGPSLFHLAQPQRGFSFQQEGPLDMRMDRSRRLKASKIVNTWPLDELKRIIRHYGDERWATKIARAIGERRQRGGIKTTKDLAQLIAEAIPKRYYPERIHPATKTFLALRIAVNEELKNLKDVLERVPFCLRKGGRLGVISFHSLEHRTVKDVLGKLSKDCICPPWFPQCVCGGKRKVMEVITKSPIVPTEEEIRANPRARSAQLRVAERV
ncbi:MAG: 16S rRNA (cytosine(1402)-N(4))-methyltransferase [Deltaproteobacteria bacterium]|nr:MAG: 16S rRNA (cytosine(1402)-N(4))-methyltransferase [Deltaproteobacteria bacterium]